MQPTGGTGTPNAAEEGAHPKPARVFVALKIAADIARELAGLCAEIAGPSIRRVAAADIHLTLVPPWMESTIPAAVGKLAGVAATHAPFELSIRHVGYRPDPRQPRFLWAECLANSELEELRAALLMVFRQTDERPFRPHVTLTRIRGNGAAIAWKHPIDRNLALSQQVISVELMQSPPAGATGYSVLASLPLGAGTPLIGPRILAD